MTRSTTKPKRPQGRPPSELLGKRFGRLVVVAQLEERRRGQVVWSCRCDCGGTVSTVSHSLTSGDRRSCGCLKKEHNSRMTPRNEPVLGLLLAGHTLSHVGKLYGITRERVRQIASTRLRLVRFWTSRDEAARLTAAAKARGLSLGQYVKDLIAKTESPA